MMLSSGRKQLIGVLLTVLGLWAGALNAAAQGAPLKVTVTRVTGTEFLEPISANVKAAKRKSRLQVILQNLTDKPLQDVHIEWTFALDGVLTRKHQGNTTVLEPGIGFFDGSKTVTVAPLEKLEFETDPVEQIRSPSNLIHIREQKLLGYRAKVDYAGKTVFVEYAPESIRKLLDARKQDEREPKHE